MALENLVRDAVVVGVDGRSDTDALTWAADQAALERRRLDIDHVAAPGGSAALPGRGVAGRPTARPRVVPTRRHGQPAARSVGTSVIRHAACPVVIARHPDDRWKAGVLVGARFPGVVAIVPEATAVRATDGETW